MGFWLRKSVLILSILLVSGALFGLYIWKERAETPATPVASTIEELRALPYVQWSDAGPNSGKRGVILHDRSRVFDGYNFTTNYLDEVYLMDMDGKILHTWKLPTKEHRLDYAELLSDGSVLISAFSDLIRVAWDSTILWQLNITSHHDIDLYSEKEYVTLFRDFRKFRSYDVNFDGIARVSSEGKVLFTWKPYEHLEQIKPLHPVSPLEVDANPATGGFDYYHMNTVKILPKTPLSSDRRFQPGNLLVCFRNVNLIAILDKDTYEIVWHWGPGEVDWPHAPTMLENGRILIFDNGLHRGFTRLLEVDPLSKKIVWEYKGNPPSEFFTDFRGLAQRLPNGNTLVCECARGRVFEINPGGTRLWEYWNAEVRAGKRKGFSFFKRIPKEKADPFLAAIKE